MNKIALFLIVVVGGTVLDLATKTWAENNLASLSEYDRVRAREALRPEPIGERLPFLYRQVEAAHDGQTAAAWFEAAFGTPADSPPGQRAIGSLHRVLDAGYTPDRGFTPPERVERLMPATPVAAGDIIEIRHRYTVVVPGFWNHVYVRNPGAAWGMFANKPESFRRPFFVGVSFVAVFFVGFIFVRTPREQALLLVALSTIISGALGNLVDRVRYGYVVDFVDWYVTWGGQERHWPTFNIADVFISVGVGLMFVEIIRGGPREPAPAETGGETADAGAADDGA
ncbi:MAG: signal peptidase II [Deltaproteobacteria bacterium]|nr:MAG: signal peptidase II [Deltaproteobacteria bacterium]